MGEQNFYSLNCKHATMLQFLSVIKMMMRKLVKESCCAARGALAGTEAESLLHTLPHTGPRRTARQAHALRTTTGSTLRAGQALRAEGLALLFLCALFSALCPQLREWTWPVAADC